MSLGAVITDTHGPELRVFVTTPVSIMHEILEHVQRFQALRTAQPSAAVGRRPRPATSGSDEERIAVVRVW
jgi:hypothetical protein